MRLFLLCFKIDREGPFHADNIARYGNICDETGLDGLCRMAPSIEGSFIVELKPTTGVKGWIVRKKKADPPIKIPKKGTILPFPKLDYDYDIVAQVEKLTDAMNEIIDHINRGLDR